MRISNDRFIRMFEEAIGAQRAAVAFSAFEQDPSVSVRLNPFKKIACFDGCVPVLWSEWGRILETRPVFTLDPHFHGGAYYVQDSSAMFVGHVFRECLKRFCPETDVIRVLDLCAAPGGKTTDVAASLREAFGERFLLVANEVMKSRAGILADNAAVWGDPNIVVTSLDPAAFAVLEGFFDIIIADVPCSGEGMFRKDDEAVRAWSEDNVALCAARQKRIIADVWPSLSAGGILIYSTCTFNTHENDDNIKWISNNLGAEILPVSHFSAPDSVIRTEHGFSLVPGFVPGEGQYCASLCKTSGVRYNLSNSKSSGVVRRRQGKLSGDVNACASADIVNFFNSPVSVRSKGDLLKAIPSGIEPYVSLIESKFHPLATGVAVGTVKGRDLVPSADLPLSIIFSEDSFEMVEVDRGTALKFLHRDNIVLPGKGFQIVCHEGTRLGFVKNLGSRCNNLYPQSRRIRMNLDF